MEMKRSSRIAVLLSERNMTQKDLAIASGLTESAISHYIKGDRVPRGVNLIKIANALKTTTDDILNITALNPSEEEMNNITTLIARNASSMSQEQRNKLIKILINAE